MPTLHVSEDFSLLWPPGLDRASVAHTQIGTNCAADLNLEALVIALQSEHCHANTIRDILLTLCADPNVIRYRQDLLEDLLRHPDLAEQLEAFLPVVADLDRYRYASRPGQTPLHEVLWRVGQLETYVEAIQSLTVIFNTTRAPFQSDALRRLRTLTVETQQDDMFKNLVVELPELLARVRNIASVSIGVNLDDQLRPVQATLLSVNKQRFHGASPSLLNALFGRGPDQQQNPWEGIAQLHSITQAPPHNPGVDFSNPMMYPLFRDLSQILKQVSRPVAAALRSYVTVNVRFLGNIRAELGFYLSAARLIERLYAHGLPMCRPELAPSEDRVCEIEATYNLQLALRVITKGGENGTPLAVIPNDVAFGPEGRIFILTGPNQGGKTTYTQAVGVAQVLAQAGLYVPGERARISPVDGIYTHFPVEERPSMEAGRLGEEARRLNDIFTHATRSSLVLLNESLASTSAGESLYLARDIVRVLRLLGVRAIYATHLHELAASVDKLNVDTPGDSQIVSLISQVNTDDALYQTYKIVPGPPMGRSYALEIASRYGISYTQLADLLEQRGVVNGH